MSINNPLTIEMPSNLLGNDYVVGDIHGCYDELQSLLKFVNFNKNVDRLFCVGDLVHRGPKSIECLELLLSKNKNGEKWFFSTFGNHEEFFEKDLNQDLLQSKHSYQEIRNAIDNIPYIYIINHPIFEQYYVLHGEFGYDLIFGKTQIETSKKNNFMLQKNTHKIIKEKITSKSLILDQDMRKQLIWSRDLFKYFENRNKIDIAKGNFDFLNNIEQNDLKIFCGHNVVPFPLRIANQYYLDTGSCFGYVQDDKIKKHFSKWGNRFFGLTLLDVNTGIAHICVSSEDIEEIETLSTSKESKIYNEMKIKRGDILTMSVPLYKGIHEI